MEVALQENLKYQLELLQFGFIQQQQSYLPFIPSPLFYHNFTMASPEETAAIAEEMSANGDTVAQMALPAAGTVVTQVAKPPRVVVRCDVCDLSFSSPSVFDSHMAGSKHQKKVKSAELLKSMESMNHEFERNEISGVIRCIVCDITVNSPQLLATHMAGNKHRANAQKRGRQDDGSDGPPAKKPCVDGEEPADATAAEGADALGAKKKKKKKKKKSATEATAGTEGTPPEDFKLPDFVSKLESEHGCYYFCNNCNAHCNSQLQLSQHLSSKKHGDKMRELSGGPAARGRRGRGGFRGRPWGSAEIPTGSAPFRGRGRGLQGFLGDERGRGGRGFSSGRGGGVLMGRGRGGEGLNSRGGFRGSFGGPPRGLLRGPLRGPLRGSSRGASGLTAPWTDSRGRGRGRAGAPPHAIGGGHQPSVEWGEENWTPASQDKGFEDRCDNWYENENTYKTGAGRGVKRPYDDSCAENSFSNQKWTADFNEAGANSWGNASTSSGGYGASSSHGGRPSLLPKRVGSGGFGGNFASENYNRGREQGDTGKFDASSSNFGGSSSSSVHATGGSNNYGAGGFNQYGANSPSNYASGGVGSYGASNCDNSNYPVGGSNNYSAGGTNSFRERGGASNEGWFAPSFVGDN